MYQRQECLVQAAICREKAQADQARYDHWIDEAIVWLQRAICTDKECAASEEDQGGRVYQKLAR
jgi:hypothetical protein